MSDKIENRMEDCGDGRHVGWWIEPSHGLGERSLLIEIDRSVLISCCEGAHAEKRINYITSREKAKAIVRDLANALGMQIKDGN